MWGWGWDGMGASLLLTPDFAPGSNDSPQAFMLYISRRLAWMIADGCAGTRTENQNPQKEGNQVQTYTNGSLTYIFSVSLVR